MKTVINKTHKPIKIFLPRGKVLHLGAGKTGQVSDDAVDREAFKRLIEAGEIEVAEGGAKGPGPGGSDSGAAHEATHGHTPPSHLHNKGDR